MIIKSNNKVSIQCILISVFLFLAPLEAFLTADMGTLLKYYQILCILYFCLFKGRNILSFKINRSMIFLLIFYLILFISLFWSTQMRRGFGYIEAIGLQIVFILVSFQYEKSEQEVRNNIIAFILGNVLLAILTIKNGQTVGAYASRFSISVDDNILDPNNIAALMAIAMIYLVNTTFLNKILSFLKCLVCILLAVAILMTGSRGAIIAILVGLLYSSILQGNVIKTLKFIAPIILGVAILIIVNKKFLQMDFIAALFERISSDDSGSNRTDIWRAVVRAIKDNPIMGYGIGSSSQIVLKYYGVSIGSHNTFLTICLEGGALASIPLILLIISLVKLRKFSVTGIGVSAGLLTALVASFFLDTYNKKIFWVPFLIIFLYSSIKKKEYL